MTKQETFDKVVNHLRKQGRRATRGPSCAYRSLDGAMCAAGCLIPDSKYRPDMEFNTCEKRVVSIVLVEEGHDVAFVKKLQGIHDRLTVDRWERALDDLARDEGLCYNPI